MLRKYLNVTCSGVALSVLFACGVANATLPNLTANVSNNGKTVTGTAVDSDHPSTVRIGVWIDGTSAGTVYASGSVFSFNIPSQYWDGQSHTLVLNAVDVFPDGSAPGSPIKTINTSFVAYPKPSATLSWSPSTVNYGESSTLTWDSNNADECFISGAQKPTSGSWVGTNRTASQLVNMYCKGPGGDSGFVSASLTVRPQNHAPSVSVSAPSQWQEGTVSSLSATASDQDGAIQNVTFKLYSANKQSLIRQISDTTSPYQIDVLGLGSGDYELVATAFDNQNKSTNAEATFTIKPAYAPLSFTGLSYTPNPAKVGEAQTFQFEYENARKCWMDATKNPRWSTDVVYFDSGSTSGETGIFKWTSPPRTQADSWVQTVSCMAENGTVVDRSVANTIIAINNESPSVSGLDVNRINYAGSPVTFKVDAIDPEGRMDSVSFSIYSRVNGTPVSTVSAVHVGGNEYRAAASIDPGQYAMSAMAFDLDGGTSRSNEVSAEFDVVAPDSPKISKLTYTNNPAQIGERQTFTLSYENVFTCYMPHEINEKWDSDVIYVPDTGVLKTGTFEVETAERLKADAWVQTVKCVGYDGQKVIASTQNVIEEVNSNLSPEEKLVAISALEYSPKIVGIGNRQVFSFSYENARRCWMDASKNEQWDTDVTYISDDGVIKSGKFVYQTAVRNTEMTWTQTVSCEGYDGTVVDASFFNQVVSGPTISNLIYGKNNPATVGEKQYLQFDYANVSKCYMDHNENPKWDVSVEYFNFEDEQNGTFRSTEALRTKEDNWIQTVTCEDLAGNKVKQSVENQVVEGELKVYKLKWNAVVGADAYRLLISQDGGNTWNKEIELTSLEYELKLTQGDYLLRLVACITDSQNNTLVCEEVSEFIEISFSVTSESNSNLSQDIINQLLSKVEFSQLSASHDFIANFALSSNLDSAGVMVEFKLNDGSWVAGKLTPQGYIFNYGMLEVGTYVLSIRVTDASGSEYITNDSFEVVTTDLVPLSTAVDPVLPPMSGPEYLGFTEGEYSVSQSGQFSYSINIDVPPGINGVQPNLSLTYNSGGAEAIAGVGVSLSGISKIERCAAEPVRDGYSSGINNGEQFKYCYNGERLVEVSTDEYRTEVESFVRIKHSPLSNSWLVEHKDGSTSYFDGTTSSVSLDGKGQPVVWYVTSYSDLFENEMNFFYIKDNGSEVVYPNIITYTKNNAVNTNKKIQLSYESRPQAIEKYKAGKFHRDSRRLKSISTLSNNEIVRVYKLEYLKSGNYYDGSLYYDPVKASRLYQITECFGGENKCAAPLELKWSKLDENSFAANVPSSFKMEDDISNELYKDSSSNMFNMPSGGFKPLREHAVRGDFDGDNKMEAAWWVCEGTNNKLSFCNHYVQMDKYSSPIVIKQNVPLVPLDSNSLTFGKVMDINSDGLDDYVITATYPGKHVGFETYISNGKDLVYSFEYSLAPEHLGEVYSYQHPFTGETKTSNTAGLFSWTDVDGDGFQDLLIFDSYYHNLLNSSGEEDGGYITPFLYGKSKISVIKNTGSGFAPKVTYGDVTDFDDSLGNLEYVSGAGKTNLPQVADVNGDGLVDLVAFMPSAGLEVAINRNGTFQVEDNWAKSWAKFPQFTIFEEEVNVPGGPYYYDCESTWNVDVVTLNDIPHFESQVVKYADVNGDGLTDIVYTSESGLYVSLSTGEVFTEPKLWSNKINLPQSICGISPDFQNKLEWSLADINQDGIQDIVLMQERLRLGSANYVNRFSVLLSDGTRFVEPVFIGDIKYIPEQRNEELNSSHFYDDVHVAIDGKLILTYGQKGTYKENPIEQNHPTGILDFYENEASYKVPTVIGVKSRTGSKKVEIDYTSIVFSSDHYTQTGPKNGQLFGSKTLTGDSILESYGYGLSENENVTVAYNRKRNIVVKALKTYEYGSLVENKQWKYSDLVVDGRGYGVLGFNEIEETSFRDGGVKFRTVNKYLNYAFNNSYMVGLLGEKAVYVTQNDTEVEGFSNRLLSKDKFDWRISEFEDDIDNKVYFADFSDKGDGAYHNSPHFYPYLIRSRKEKYEINTGDLIDINYYSMFTERRDIEQYICYEFDIDHNPNSFILDMHSYMDLFGNVRYSATYSCLNSHKLGQYIENTNILNITESDAWVIGLVGFENIISWNYNSSEGYLSILSNENEKQYDNKGRLTRSTRMPNGKPDEYLSTSFSYNQFGGVEESIQTVKVFENDGINFKERRFTLNQSYSPDDGSSILVKTNPLGHVSTAKFDPKYGGEKYLKTEQGIEVFYERDALGRVINKVDSNNIEQNYQYVDCDDTCSSHIGQAKWYIVNKETGKSPVVEYRDLDNRTVGGKILSLDGRPIYSSVVYDKYGRVVQESAPFFSAPIWTFYKYDILGRQIERRNVEEGTTAVRYGNLFGNSKYGTNVWTQTNAKGIDTVHILRQDDKEVSVLDAMGNSVNYEYAGNGQLSKVNVTTGDFRKDVSYEFYYDKLGRQTGLFDPNIGRVSYAYNGFDYKVYRENAVGEKQYFEYDRLGRLVSRTDVEALGKSQTHFWTYDTANFGIGALAKIEGLTTSGNNFTQSFTYNKFGDLSTNSISLGSESYSWEIRYDDFGRKAGFVYPMGYSLARDYNEFGYVSQIRFTGNEVIWSASKSDEFKNVTQATYGDGSFVERDFTAVRGLPSSILVQNKSKEIISHRYDYDYLGNLKARHDDVFNISQYACYDSLSRLVLLGEDICTDQLFNVESNNMYAYDFLGNLTKKANIDDYLYGPTDLSPNAGPHAVSYANGQVFNYDLSGRLISNGLRSVQYSALGKPTLFSESGRESHFEYDPENRRVARKDDDGHRSVEYTYIDLNSQLIRRSNASDQLRLYLDDFAVFNLNLDSGKGTLNYLFKDHLGSVVAQSKLSHDYEVDVQYLSNDVWGQRRRDNWLGSELNQSNSEELDELNGISNRGFTDHEHIDSMTLIHMNGRVYDPVVGRFLSPDPHIQALKNSQSFNRYSYVWNNPLSFNDPSGEIICSIINCQGTGVKQKDPSNKKNTKNLSDIDRAILDNIGDAVGYTFESLAVAGHLFGNRVAALSESPLPGAPVIANDYSLKQAASFARTEYDGVPSFYGEALVSMYSAQISLNYDLTAPIAKLTGSGLPSGMSAFSLKGSHSISSGVNKEEYSSQTSLEYLKLGSKKLNISFASNLGGTKHDLMTNKVETTNNVSSVIDPGLNLDISVSSGAYQMKLEGVSFFKDNNFSPSLENMQLGGEIGVDLLPMFKGAVEVKAEVSLNNMLTTFGSTDEMIRANKSFESFKAYQDKTK